MGITYQENGRLFTLHTEHTTYQMKVDQYGYLLHLYYGGRADGSMEYLLNYEDRGFSGNPYEAGSDRTYSLDALPQEYPTQGTGDYRSPALVVKNGDGSVSTVLKYAGHSIVAGKYGLPGLPAVYAEAGENAGTQDCVGEADCADKTACMDRADRAETLEIYLEDRANGLRVTLFYGVLPKRDVITRAVKVENRGGADLELLKVQTACLDFLYGDYDLISFYGRHAMERNYQRTAVGHGAQVIGSRRGTSSHQYNPFVILAGREATERHGECYGLSFVYSGMFKAEAERDQYGQTRISMGLQDELFSCVLKAGETFYGPEVILSCTTEGLSALSHNFHRVIRHNLCRGIYKTARRPVLINNWEATYFDFDGEKLYQIAKQASELGVEMFVLDDGWFGNRNTDTTGLGDWSVNEAKLGCTLGELAERINGLGLKFGLWVEPEMISEDSGLYRAHPDWAFAVPGRRPVRARDQLVLDFSRKEVREHIFESICQVLDHANIEYIKWDMNRSIADVYSATASREDQGMVMYRYMLGLYDFLERLLARYPGLLIEGCSGGGRFDAGMLYYTPQIWCSDNTDAVDRIHIQYGTSFGYPVSAVGSHVSAVPNHQNGRITSMETRGCVAMAGSFGYELDLSRLTEEEKVCVKEQTAEYKKYWNLIHNGDYYRLTCPPAGDALGAWMYVSEDKGEALMQAVTLEAHGNPLTLSVRLAGLDPKGMYENTETGSRYCGAALMEAGIPLPQLKEEYQSCKLHLRRIQAEHG